MERWAVLRRVRERSHASGQPRQDAVLVLGLPLLFQRADGHRSGVVEDPPAQMGYRDLPGDHQP